LDGFHWGPNWSRRPDEDFRRLVAEATADNRWIIDGNYTIVQDIVLARATTVIWLNYGFATIFTRALVRTIRRTLFAEELFSGNRETFTKSFFSRESILWWVVTTFRKRRKQYLELRKAQRYPQLEWLELRTPAEAERVLNEQLGVLEWAKE
jgi:hypothetical protein